MDRLLSRRGLAVIALAACAASCSQRDRQLHDHLASLSSVSASVKRIGEAWLSGETSGTYSETALQQMLTTTEQERAALSSAPLLSDPRGAALADSASELSRHVARMIVAIRGGDGDEVRGHLKALPFSNAS